MSKLVSSTLATVSTVKTKTPPGRGLHEADDGDRTRDPHLGKLMLYQLSYVREESFRIAR
jgi:hypothetical protein